MPGLPPELRRPGPRVPRRLGQSAPTGDIRLHRQRAQDGEVRGREGSDRDHQSDESVKSASHDTIGTFNIVPYQSTHINGGTLMGDDPSDRLSTNTVRYGGY